MEAQVETMHQFQRLHHPHSPRSRGLHQALFPGTERLASAIGNGGLADIGIVGSEGLIDKRMDRDSLLRRVMAPYPLRINRNRLDTLYAMTRPDTTAELTYFFHPDHLGSASWITDLSGQPVQHLQYKPFGGDYIDQQDPNTEYSERFRFTGKERDAETGFDYFGARYYSSSLGIWLSVDPMSDKYPSLSPYVYCADNPVVRIDIDGREPIKPYAGTIAGFVSFMNSLSTGIGTSTGAKAHTAMLRMGIIRYTMKGPKPANTAPFNGAGGNRYIYTEKGGWIDMAHFMFYAGKAYAYKQDKQQAQDLVSRKDFAFMSPEVQLQWLKQANMNPVSEAIQAGYLQELGDKLNAPQSAYSYEDLPSDKFGADFGANYFNPNSKQTFSEQIQNYFNDVLKATNPYDAPNYRGLPEDYPHKPTQTNKTTKPLYINNNP